MATGIGASGACAPVRAACSDRRPSLPWTSPNQPGRRYHGGARAWQIRAGRPRETLIRTAESSLKQKRRPESRLFVKTGQLGLDQFAALLAGLSVEVLSAVVGAIRLTLAPCKRSSAIFKALSS